MNCPKCGNPIESGEIFCGNCGTKLDMQAQTQGVQQQPVQEQQQQQPVQEQQQQQQQQPVQQQQQQTPAGGFDTPAFGEFQEEKAEPKPKKKMPKWFKPVVALGTAAVLVVTVFLVPFTRNWLLKTFMNPKDYHKMVQETNLKNLSNDAASLLSLLKSGNITAEGNISFKLGDAVQELLPRDADWLESGKLNYTLSTKDNLMALGAGVTLNEETIIDEITVTMDFDESALYLSAPDLTNHSYKIELPDLSYYAGNPAQSIKRLAKILPDEKTTADLIYKYAKIALNEIKDVEEESVKLSAGDVKASVTELRAKIDEKTVSNIVVAILKEAKNDKEIEKLVKNISEYSDMDANDSYKNFQNGIDMMLESYDSSYFDSHQTIDVISYVDGNGTVIGMGVEVEGAKARFFNITSGSKVGSYYGVEAPQGGLALEGSGKKSGGKLSGSYALQAQAMGMKIDIVDIDVTDMDTKKMDKGYFNGTFTISAAKQIRSFIPSSTEEIEMLFDSKLVVMLDSSETSRSASVAAYHKDDLLAELAASASLKPCTDLAAPKNAKELTSYNAGRTLLNDIDASKLITRLTKAGVPFSLLGNMR